MPAEQAAAAPEHLLGPELLDVMPRPACSSRRADGGRAAEHALEQPRGVGRATGPRIRSRVGNGVSGAVAREQPRRPRRVAQVGRQPVVQARPAQRRAAGAPTSDHARPDQQPEQRAPVSARPLTAAPAPPRAAGRCAASAGRRPGTAPPPTASTTQPGRRVVGVDRLRAAATAAASTTHGAATASRAALTVQPCRVSSSARVRASSRRNADRVRSSRPRSLPPTSRAIRSDSTIRSPTGSARSALSRSRHS